LKWAKKDGVKVFACGSFYNAARFDFVAVRAQDGEFYARLLALFRVSPGPDRWRTMALVQWLHDDVPQHLPEARTFAYYRAQPDVIPFTAVLRKVRMVSSLRNHLGRRLFCMLNYGHADDS
jgi:hypothetical protein